MLKKIILKIKDIDCVSCAITVDGELEDTEGVKEAKTSYAKQLIEVEYDEKKLDEEKIRGIIKKVGYDTVLAQ